MLAIGPGAYWDGNMHAQILWPDRRSIWSNSYLSDDTNRAAQLGFPQVVGGSEDR
jgi:hypothetical protein